MEVSWCVDWEILIYTALFMLDVYFNFSSTENLPDGRPDDTNKTVSSPKDLNNGAGKYATMK